MQIITKKLKKLEDTYRHKGLRKRLIETIYDKVIRSESVLEAMFQIPRHFFLEKAFEELAYQDKAFPIGMEQTISQPYTVAYQTELLQIKKREKVLEIGTGSGYQAAVLAVMGGRVYTVERHESLYRQAKVMFEKLKLINVRAYHKDGYKGLPEFAPFDKILVTAAAATVPETLKQQLAVGGKLVIPLGEASKTQVMQRLTRLSATEFEVESFDTFRFVPFLEGKL